MGFCKRCNKNYSKETPKQKICKTCQNIAENKRKKSLENHFNNTIPTIQWLLKLTEKLKRPSQIERHTAIFILEKERKKAWHVYNLNRKNDKAKEYHEFIVKALKSAKLK